MKANAKSLDSEAQDVAVDNKAHKKHAAVGNVASMAKSETEPNTLQRFPRNLLLKQRRVNGAESATDSSEQFTEIEMHSTKDQQQTPLNGKHRTKTQSRKRDLINLQSNLSPKYIGFANANSPTTVTETTMPESADQGRKTRRRNHAATPNISSNELNGRDSDNASPKMLTAGMPILSSGASRVGGAYLSPIDKLLIKNGANSPNSTGFEADAEDVAVVQRKTVKRKLKRGTKTKSKSTNEKVIEETGKEMIKQEELPLEIYQMVTDNEPKLAIKVEITDEIAAIVAGDTELEAGAMTIDQTNIFALPVATSAEFETLKSPQDHRESVNNSEQSLKSPSSISLDSAKGSSIVTDLGWPTYHVGDLYWGKLFTYCYWPCMVCPDELGQIVGDQHTHPQRKSTDSVPGLALSVQVHVRFFADNGRHNWIKSENLLLFTGQKAYEDLRENVRIQHGPRSLKYRQMVAKQSKLQVWHQAIEEANSVAQLPYDDRLKKFNDIHENSITFNKQKRKQKISIRRDTSDVGSSLCDSADNLNGKTLAIKRERSSSPFSPAFSPVKTNHLKRAKRRKLSGSVEEQVGLTSVPEEQDVKPISLDLGNSEDPEFRFLFEAIKDYVMVHPQGDKVDKILMAVVNNIWSLKQIQLRELERDLAEGDVELLGSARLTSERDRGMGQIKRLSNRLRTMVLRRSLTPIVNPSPTAATDAIKAKRHQSEQSKVRKPVGRPIDEVVQDILKLDRKYLFRGLNREPVCKYCHEPGGEIKRCSRQCSTWFHAACLEQQRTGLRKPKRGQKAITAASAATTTARISSKVLGPLTSSSSISDVEAPVKHITGDGMPAEQENDSVICYECSWGKSDICCICHQEELPENSPPASPLKDGEKIVAKVAQEPLSKLLSCCQPMCNAKFHARCCKYWPQASISNSSAASRCPKHVCHTCVSNDPSGKYQQLGNSKLIKCVKCPATYHQDSRCLPAGSRMLTLTYLICPRHNVAKADASINVLWCYICVKGGELVCCETCPIAVHAHCRNIPIKKNESYICEECESGRLPLYGEIVWAKFNNFRWWPSIILPPTEVPLNIQKKPHGINDFVVRFFGTHDHGWISRRRVYLYIEGDTGDTNKNQSQMSKNYQTGVEEATRFLKIIKDKRQEQAILRSSRNKLQPPPYVKIKANKAVPPVRLVGNEQDLSICTCAPHSSHPCSIEARCLNRMLYNECNPKLCLAGNKCENQVIELRKSPRLEVVYMNERGFGLVCREPIIQGNFIIEYVGEVINDAEFQRRIAQKQNDRDENFYFLGVEKNFIIDAGPKGNLARFMNHSCDPNCETQKWKINGIHRIGLFAIKDIPENTELTFNYLWEDLLNNDKKACFCGTSLCSGKIGDKPVIELNKVSAEAKVKQVSGQGIVNGNGAALKKKSESNHKTADDPSTSEAAGRRSRS